MTRIQERRPRAPGRTTATITGGQYRQLAIAALVLLSSLVIGAGLVIRGWYNAEQTDAARQPAGEVTTGGMAGTDLDSEAYAAEQPAIPDAVLSPDASVRQTGPGTFTYGAGGGTPVGAAGTLRRYQVAVEDDIGQDVAAFGEIVDAILGDQRSWIAGKDVRLQRVGKDAAADFTIFLATPTTSERMCAAVGLRTKKYTSCRAGHKVIINLARWLTAVPNYGASVATYRQYVVNHEVGHELGHGHEACPGRGKKAPTMQQQTFGLDGCVPNPWPYLGGKRYTGPSAA